MTQHNENTLTKTELIAKLSHEMRTPLAAILGHAETMYDARQTVAERLNAVGRIRKNVAHITKLIEDIASLAKMEKGLLSIIQEPIAIRTELSEIFAVMEARAKQKRLQLDCHYVGDIPDKLTTDRVRLLQMIGNLLENAITFTDRGKVQAFVRYDKPNHILEIKVHDNGRIILPHEQRYLFEPGQFPNDLPNTLVRSDGLGLQLTRELSRLLGGDLTLNDEPTRAGNIFSLKIRATPALQPYGQEVEVISSRLRERESLLNGMHILIVEDAREIQFLLSHCLSIHGATITVATQGAEAIEKAKHHAFDLILMDLQLPQFNGIDATKELRRLGIQTPIIAITAHSTSLLKEQCFHAGYSDYLTKPIELTKLLEITAHYKKAA